MDERELFELVGCDSSFLVAIHEMKAPLSIIRQLSLTLNDSEIELESSERDKILRQIDITSDRALRLVQDLTKVSRLEDAMFELEPVNVRKICDDICRDMNDVFALHERKITFKTQKKCNLVVANYNLLYSVLMNFSDNALHSAKKHSKVEIMAKNVGSKVRISVRNYGDELPTEIWRAIKKQKNHQPVRVASRPQSSGLGIFVAQNFAKSMGGTIGVIRHKNGNTFYIDLNKSEQLSLL